MGVQDGFPVNQSYTNTKFISKNVDDAMPNILAFTRSLSGATISDIQAAVNKLYGATGASETTPGTVYDAPPGTISNGENYETALGLLADKFAAATGHMHTGADGDAPPISSGDISNFPLLGYLEQGTTLTGVTGNSKNVSTQLSGKSSSTTSTMAGVCSGAPSNKVRLIYATGASAYQDIIDSTGNLVYGRISFASSVFTLSFYSEISGVETPFDFTSATDILWWYQELFAPNAAPPTYLPVIDLFTGTAASLHSVAASGHSQLQGDVIFAASGGLSLTQVGQDLIFVPNIHSIAVMGQSPVVGDIIFAATGGTNIHSVGNTVYIGSATGGTGGGGTGLKNYLGEINGVNNNGDFELGTTTGWTLGNVGTLANNFPTGTPTFGSGASGNLSIATISSGQLAGSFSLEQVSSAASVAGDFLASNVFTIDEEDQAKVMQFKFYYKPNSGVANLNFSGTQSNSFGVAIWDVTNGVWIQPAGVFNLVQNSGVGLALGTFQTTSNSTQYRFVVYNANASLGAATMYFDDFFLGPQITAAGAAVSDWVAYTPTVNNVGTSTNTGCWRRVGDSIEIETYLVSSGAFVGSPQIAIPTQFSIDFNKLPNTIATVGVARLNNSGAIWIGPVTTVGLAQALQIAGPNSQGDWSASTPTSSGSGMVLSLFARLPIIGWSSQTVMSNDTDTRVIAASTGQASTQALTDGVFAKVAYDTPDFDTSGSLSGGTFTVPVAGIYKVKALVQYGVSSVGYREVDLYKNGTTFKALNFLGSELSPSYGTLIGGSCLVPCVAGDTLEIYASENSGTSVNIGGNAAYNYFNVNRLSGPATIAATESVVAQYIGGGGADQTFGAFTAAVNFPTKLIDTHGAVTPGVGTWLFRAPISGSYEYQGNFYQKTTDTDVYQYVNGVQGIAIPGHFTGNFASNHFYGMVYLNAGDYLQIIPQTASTGSDAALYNLITIKRIGN